MALVRGLALHRAALNGATSSPTAEMMLELVVEQFDAKSLERAGNWGLLWRFSKIQSISHRDTCESVWLWSDRDRQGLCAVGHRGFRARCGRELDVGWSLDIQLGR